MFSKELRNISRDPRKTTVLFLLFAQNNEPEFLRIAEQNSLTEALVALGAQNFESKRRSYARRMKESEERSPNAPR